MGTIVVAAFVRQAGLATGSDLFGENCDVLVEGFGGADVAAGDGRVPRRAGGQLALLEDEGEERKEWMPENNSSD